jgi:hypothetical protein
MIYSMLEVDIRDAVFKAENMNTDGTINWNFVDADVYASNVNLWKDDEQFYEAFNEIADQVAKEMTPKATATQLEMDFDLLARYPNAVEQVEVLKTDFLGM